MIIKARKAAGVAIAAFFLAAIVVSMAVRHAPPSLSAEGDESERWFISQRAFPAREIPAGVLERAVAALHVFPKVRANLAIPGDTWASIGPQAINDPVTRSTWSGRVMTIAPHPTDPDTLYLGADLGGVWKTTDAGQTWSMVTPDLAFPAIRWLAIDPINPDILYAATPPGAYASRLHLLQDGLGAVDEEHRVGRFAALPSVSRPVRLRHMSHVLLSGPLPTDAARRAWRQFA